MGLLKNIVGNAISNGISKGISAAVGQAVEKAVAPAAERMAEKGAEAINSATAEIDKGISEVKASTEESVSTAKEAVNAAGGLAGLESALAGLASRAEAFATSMSASMKVCPNCGQPSPADKDFCPNCGTKLPERTLGQDYTCSKCGTANTPGTKFCSKCGALLPGAEAEVKAQQAKDNAVLEEMAAKLPQFPKWSTGGANFEFEENGEQNGYPVYRLCLDGGYKELDAYKDLLLQAGFTKQEEEYWKTVNGVCHTFSAYDAVCDGRVDVGFYVSTYDRKPEPKPAADPAAELRDVAKGLFKKLLG